MHRLFLIGLIIACLATPTVASESNSSLVDTEAQRDTSKEKQTSGPLVTPEVRGAIRKGLDWLAEHQTASGAFGDRYKVAQTAMAGMAFLSSGSLPPNRGRYSKNIENAVDFLINQARGRRGYISADRGSRMHGHGYATQFLAQVYGATRGTFRSEKLREVLENAVDVIAQAQDETGGWTYTPRRSGHEGSVTITQIAAMRACKNVGFRVPKATIKKSIQYVKKSHVGEGGFSYQVGQGGARPGLTGAMVSTLNYTGVYGQSAGSTEKKAAKIVEMGIKRMQRKDSPAGTETQYGAYGYFNEGQAFFFAGAETWRNWYRSFSKTVLPEQSSSGKWDVGQTAALDTAMILVILQLPYQYLPEMQR